MPNCTRPWDVYRDDQRCAVCRTLVLVCPPCAAEAAEAAAAAAAAAATATAEMECGASGESGSTKAVRARDGDDYPRGFYCDEHDWLSETRLQPLLSRLAQHEAELAVLGDGGRRSKGRRRTLRKQIGWVQARVRELQANNNAW